MTPGQAAYEEWKRACGLSAAHMPEWDYLPLRAKMGWDEIAFAAVKCAVDLQEE